MWGLDNVALLLVFALFVFCILYSILWYARIPSKLPPGPIGFPVIGCIPYIESKTAYLTLSEWREKYGNVMSFYMGSTLVVVLADYEAIREALIRQGEVFNGRTIIKAFRPSQGIAMNLGLTGAEGELWREQRGFCLRTLKDFGVGRSILEPKVRQEVQFLINSIAKSEGRPLDLTMLLHYAVSNVVVQLVFGKRFDYDDPVYIGYLEKLAFRLTKSGVNSMSTFNFLPSLLALQGMRSRVKTIRDDSNAILDFIRQFYREKVAKFDIHEEPEDYMTAFLKAQLNGEGRHFHEDQLVISVQQLFIAGSETTATTLRWAIWYMATFPEYQEKVYKEIVSTVGTDQPPLWADHSRMPFTEATITEVMRASNLAPLSITHRNVEDTKLFGYHIPKDSYVIPFLYSVHRDPAYFPDPDVFRPERFIDSDGKFVKNIACIPFSAGKRTCLGESLARMELFTYLTGMIQRFHFRFPDGVINQGDCPVTVGVIVSPAPFDVVAELRTWLH